MPNKKVNGYNELVTEAEKIKKPKKVFAFISSEWCIYCAIALPALEKLIKNHKEITVLSCDVGDMPTWKDKNNEFRKILNVQEIPTFLDWTNKEKRATGMQCSNYELLEMVIDEE